MPNPRVVLIFWDNYFSTTPAAVTSMNQFVWSLVAGPYMKGLQQYGVIGGSVAGSIVINMKTYPAPASLNEGQLNAQLTAWLDNGTVTPKPAGDEQNLVYLILPPSTTTMSFQGQTTGFCGYHQHADYHPTADSNNLFWATVVGYTQSADGPTFVNSVAYCMSHELCETFTNRDGDGYYADNGCEIGDICEADTANNILKYPYFQWQIEKYWSEADKTCVFGTWIQVPSPAVVNSLTRFRDHIDLFVTGLEGGVYSTFWDASRGWFWTWFRLTDPAFGDQFTIPQGAPIRSLTRFQDHIDLFVAGRDGGVYSTFWDANGGWFNHWFRLTDPAFGDGFTIPPVSEVASISRFQNHIDLFAVGRDGGVYSTFWDQNGGWFNRWFRLMDPAFFDQFTVPPLTRIAVLARLATHLDLFVTGRDGGVYSTFWDQSGGWFNHWFRLTDPAFGDQFTVVPGTPVSAMARYPTHIDLFVVGRDGGVYSTFWDQNGGWFNHWFRLMDPAFGDQFTVPPGSPVTALTRFPDHIDLFVVGRDGGIYSTFWDQSGGWFNHWFRLGDTNFGDDFTVPPGSTISAMSRFQDHIDLFVVGRDGGVYSTFWDANGGWFNHWFRV